MQKLQEYIRSIMLTKGSSLMGIISFINYKMISNILLTTVTVKHWTIIYNAYKLSLISLLKEEQILEYYT